jgi:acyl carrier protein
LIEYWRIEKPNSILIVTTYKNYFILPTPKFRQGINKKTLDFPGGRQQTDNILSDARKIICRELKIENDDIEYIKELDTKKYIINSSFNSQLVIYLEASLKKMNENTHFIKCSFTEIHRLLNDLECLQCAFGLNLYFNKNRNKIENIIL